MVLTVEDDCGIEDAWFLLAAGSILQGDLKDEREQKARRIIEAKKLAVESEKQQKNLDERKARQLGLTFQKMQIDGLAEKKRQSQEEKEALAWALAEHRRNRREGAAYGAHKNPPPRNPHYREKVPSAPYEDEVHNEWTKRAGGQREWN
jgi:hypothetical protein